MSPQVDLETAAGSNSDFPWDDFDTKDYVEHNYSRLRDDDQEILVRVRDFFAHAQIPEGAQGIDIGTGPNLYPALAMLPFCKKISLRERAASNVRWLKNEIRDYSTWWDQFWQVLAEIPPYSSISNPRELIRERVRVKRTDIFRTGMFRPRPLRWDLGTMFFVAESISPEWHEFQVATHRFVRLLKPGAPFAAAFMEGSLGYEVGDRRFPAVSIGEGDVRKCLADVAHDVDIQPIASNKPLRQGYHGMLLALGRAGGR